MEAGIQPLPPPPAPGVFVTGTDTGVGKTVVSALLTAAWEADYWKPVQTGADLDSDSDTVAALIGVDKSSGGRVHPPRLVLSAPRAPAEAAAMEGAAISLEMFSLPRAARPLVVEGAGGVLVPVSESAMMADLITHLGLAVVVVARTRLGTINHTLLTLEALSRRQVPVLGLVFNGPSDARAEASILRHSGARVLARIPPFKPLTPAVIDTWGRRLAPRQGGVVDG